MDMPSPIYVIDTHTAGEPTRIWITALIGAPGNTMRERAMWLQQERDDLRRFLVQEPRGHRGMSGAIVCTPLDSAAQVGVVYMDNYRYMPMCGHATIGVITALVETGYILNMARETSILLDTPAGLVQTMYRGDSERVTEVTFRNVPSYHLLRSSVDIVGVGTVPFDVAYGGNLFALVSVEPLKLAIQPERLPALVDLGTAILKSIDRDHCVAEPATGKRQRVTWIEFYDDTVSPPRNVVMGAAESGRTGELLRCNKVDRSPCGTGLSAKLAMLHAHGMLREGEDYPYRSVLDTEFRGRIVGEATVHGRDAIVPEVTGSAAIIGTHMLHARSEDSFGMGFVLSEG